MPRESPCLSRERDQRRSYPLHRHLLEHFASQQNAIRTLIALDTDRTPCRLECLPKPTHPDPDKQKGKKQKTKPVVSRATRVNDPVIVGQPTKYRRKSIEPKENTEATSQKPAAVSRAHTRMTQSLLDTQQIKAGDKRTEGKCTNPENASKRQTQKRQKGSSSEAKRQNPEKHQVKRKKP